MWEKTYDGDIFDLPKAGEAVCVTTNGIVKRNGELVMGAGIALSAASKYPCLPKILGERVEKYGNHVYGIPVSKISGFSPALTTFTIFSFPTKTHFKYSSDPELIRRSAMELVLWVNRYDVRRIYMTRPGCSCGKLDWITEVKPVIYDILDDRFIVISRTPHP